MLIECKAYIAQRRNLFNMWVQTKNPVTLSLVSDAILNTREFLLQYILDCSILPKVIDATQVHGKQVLEDLFYLTRTFCFVIHKERLRML